ncbi:nucleotide pyrophosphohydrolase [Vibrio tubiashii]|uniref:nucleotide pyrophosphohydrolase n=1 Tax=Vibrio tubiashii TaxID=29498 RepID=UPI00234EC27B|nr:nucleotide pyrophosphohydrolase [Vibrio tubiashii]WCP68780.1 nucleotide pyrophosphohydrolase [Vibrio tubiashii]
MSKTVYVAGSFKNLARMQAIRSQLMREGVEVLISEPQQSGGIDGCLERIKQSDMIYILNFEGYVGKSVALDIGYALGLGKPVYALEPISDPDVSHLLTKILTPEMMLQELK